MSECSGAPSAVLFDLDGTLVDTAPDLAAATNALRARHALPPLPVATIRGEISRGASALVALALGIEADHPQHDEAKGYLLARYADGVALESALFDGLGGVLTRYRRAGRPWGIVTNKPRHFTAALLDALGLRPDVLLCADDLPVVKPDPAPLLAAAGRLGAAPETCWYIGDHLRDIQAARSAGMTAIAATYGYLHEEDDPNTWQADRIVTTPAELAALLLSSLGIPGDDAAAPA